MARLLLDNDVVAKLAQYDLFDEFLALPNNQCSVEVLPTLRYRFRLSEPQRAARILKGERVVSTIISFLGKVAEIPDVPSPELVRLLSERPEIDPGEIVLFSIAAVDASCLVCTGDKRAVAAIAQSAKDHEPLERLRGRIKCLEQIVAEMMFAPNARTTLLKIRSKEWDTALRLCCASGGPQDAVTALHSYYRYLNAECAGLLAPFPASA
jgi:hypothetical protein